jgi:hypothetical protein
MLASAVQRRFPPGLKLLVYDGPALPAPPPPGGQLAALAAALRDWGLSVTRCGGGGAAECSIRACWGPITWGLGLPNIVAMIQQHHSFAYTKSSKLREGLHRAKVEHAARAR